MKDRNGESVHWTSNKVKDLRTNGFNILSLFIGEETVGQFF